MSKETINSLHNLLWMPQDWIIWVLLFLKKQTNICTWDNLIYCSLVKSSPRRPRQACHTRHRTKPSDPHCQLYCASERHCRQTGTPESHQSSLVMDNLGMSTRKVAAVTGLGIGAMLLLKGGELLDSAEFGYPTWKETGLFGAPAQAVVCIIAGASFLAVGWLYRLLFCPLELLRALEDVGYIAENGRSRAQVANEVRRRRKTGELPPVYPNGWYRVLDSHMLNRGEVKNVSALGMISLHLQ